MRCAARPSSQRTHTFSHALTRAFSRPLPAGLQQPKASDEPKTAADDGPNPYGARTMSVVLRMNRAEQNAGNFKVRHSLDPLVHQPSPLRRPVIAQVGCDLDDSNVATKVKEGTPAARAGLQVSDQITNLDGEPLAGRKVKDVLAKKALHTFTILRRPLQVV
jgi:membrane-associated protease RseP (regulator of RpoE activity)